MKTLTPIFSETAGDILMEFGRSVGLVNPYVAFRAESKIFETGSPKKFRNFSHFFGIFGFRVPYRSHWAFSAPEFGIS